MNEFTCSTCCNKYPADVSCRYCYEQQCPTCQQPVYRDESFRKLGGGRLAHVRCGLGPRARPEHMKSVTEIA